MRIALVGNPNSGKTALFNALTGKNEMVGNRPGVTVGEKDGRLSRKYRRAEDVVLTDLPGIYSLFPYTPEERVSTELIRGGGFDVIIDVVDATSPSRSLYLTAEIAELKTPVVVALNKSDATRLPPKDVMALEKKLGYPVVCTSPKSGEGIAELIDAAVSVKGKTRHAPIDNRVLHIATEKKAGVGDKVDAVIMRPIVGVPLFVFVMFTLLRISQSAPVLRLSDMLSGILTFCQGKLAEFIGTGGAISRTLIYGAFGGFISVVGFLPVICVMCFLVSLLEDVGYMARVCALFESLFRKFGLDGRSVVSFVLGTGCSVTGITASRTIRDEDERRATVALTPFVPCSAKLPVISLFAAKFFGGSSFVGAAVYFVGVLIVLLGAIVIRAVTGAADKRTFFIIELPDYKLPSVRQALRAALERAAEFVRRAGTLITICNAIVYVMLEHGSLLFAVSLPFAYFFAPVTGSVCRQSTAAVLTGLLAKENIVATLSACFPDGDIGTSLGFSPASALAYLSLCLFTPPCFSAIGAMRAELSSRRLLAATVGFQFGTGYTIGFLINFIAGERMPLWMDMLGFCVVGVFALAVLAVRHSGVLVGAGKCDGCKGCAKLK